MRNFAENRVFEAGVFKRLLLARLIHMRIPKDVAGIGQRSDPQRQK